MPNDKTIFDIRDLEIVSRETCYDGFLRVEKLQVKHRLFAGGWSEVFTRELLVKKPAVGILLFDAQRDQVVLVRQFRIGVIDEQQSPWLVELVAGMVDHDEPLELVAVREAKEEANCVTADLIKICDYYNSPGGSKEKVSLYCGRVDASSAGGNYGLKAEHEDIQVVVLSSQDVIESVDSGAINNAMTIIAIRWLQLHKEDLLQRWNH